jgi:hypothetical protein
MKKNIILIVTCLCLAACGKTYYAVIEDKSPCSWSKERKLKLTEIRGNTMISISTIDTNRDMHKYYLDKGFYSKKGIYKMWGYPDKVESKKGIDYCSFSIERYDSGSTPPGPAILGFRGDKLVYIQTWQASSDKNIKPVIIP